MRSTTIIAAVSLGLALAACGKKNDTSTTTGDANMSSDMNASMNTGDMNMGSDMNSSMNGSSNMASTAAMPAQQFVDTVAGTDMYEIQSGKMAETMASTPALKDFGKMLVTDHTKSSSMMKAAAAKTKPMVSIPVALPAEMKTMLDTLKAAKGADFDKLFMQQQTEGHQKALDALKAYAAGGDQPSLQDFATKATPVVQGHLTKLQAMPQ
ncbi:MAG: DUF4142 domain-containing protein [Sphingomicrobium sp.]|nr:DUF4142 domain-containing protein [Sphingomonadales bacterium]